MLWSIDSCQKGYPLTSVTWLYRSSVQLTEVTCFFKVNLVCSVITGKSQTWALMASVWDFPVMTSISVNKLYLKFQDYDILAKTRSSTTTAGSRQNDAGSRARTP